MYNRHMLLTLEMLQIQSLGFLTKLRTIHNIFHWAPNVGKSPNRHSNVLRVLKSPAKHDISFGCTSATDHTT